MMSYKWTPPKIVVGDYAKFIDRYETIRMGMCVQVTTRYTHKWVAYHEYEMQVSGRSRRMHITDYDLL